MQTRGRKIRQGVDVKNICECAWTYLSCPAAVSQGRTAIAAFAVLNPVVVILYSARKASGCEGGLSKLEIKNTQQRS